MTSINITFSDDALQEAIAQQITRFTDLTPQMEAIGEYMLLQTRSRFDNQQDPEGRPWAPLSPGYVKRKAKDSRALRGILTLTGALRDTVSYEADRDSVRVGSNRPYAEYHQAGTGKMPSRPFLGLNEADRAEILEILRDGFEG